MREASRHKPPPTNGVTLFHRRRGQGPLSDACIACDFLYGAIWAKLLMSIPSELAIVLSSVSQTFKSV